MDRVDFHILSRLSREGRTTWSELAGQLNLSAPAVTDRVRKLEDRGVITGYSARLDPERAGWGVTAFVAVTLEKPEHRAPFLQMVQDSLEIQECFHVAGDDDYLLKVRCRNMRHLEQLVSEQLKGLKGVVRTRTTIVLSAVKESPVTPAGTEDD